jgi:hypothetical protein
LGQRSRKRGRREKPVEQRVARSATATRPRPARAARTLPRSRAAERDAAVRATLDPFAPGERPWPIQVGAAVALLLGSVNLVLYVAGVKPHVGGKQPQLGEILVFSTLMLVCCAGMWRMRYWAVLGFQTLLAIGLLGFSLALIRASSVLGAAICVGVIVPGGLLFYKLVRVLGRLQLPAPPTRR